MRLRSLSLLGVVIAALLALGAWALSAPLASSPDDNFHMPSLWCAHGTGGDRCHEVRKDPDSRSVPVQASVKVSCYVFDPLESASCQQPVMADAGARTVVTFGNWQGVYPPVYYWVNGWWVTSDTVLSVLLIRAFTGLVVVALLAALVCLVPRQLRSVAVVPLVALSVPLAASLYSSTNPSAWGITAPAVLWVALHAAYASAGRTRWALCGLALLATLLGAGARADACLFCAMAVVLTFVLNLPRLRASLLPTLTGMASIALAAVLFLSADQSGALSAGLVSDQVLGDKSTTGVIELTVSNLGQLSTLFTGFLGTTPIGWLDTPMPGVVPFLSVAAVTVLLALSWRRAPSRGHAVALALSGLSLFVYPLYILARSHLAVGQGVQPRYLLPLAVIFTGLVLLTGGARLSLMQSRVVAAALAVSHSVALHVQLRRYVTGLDVSSWNLDAHQEWWWNRMPVGPTVVWVVGSLAFAVLAVAAMRLCVAEPRSHAPRPVEGALQ